MGIKRGGGQAGTVSRDISSSLHSAVVEGRFSRPPVSCSYMAQILSCKVKKSQPSAHIHRGGQNCTHQ